MPQRSWDFDSHPSSCRHSLSVARPSIPSRTITFCHPSLTPPSLGHSEASHPISATPWPLPTDHLESRQLSESLPGRVHRGISEVVPCDNSVHYFSVHDGLLVGQFISRLYRIALILHDALRTLLAEIDLFSDELTALVLFSMCSCIRISLVNSRPVLPRRYLYGTLCACLWLAPLRTLIF